MEQINPINISQIQNDQISSTTFNTSTNEPNSNLEENFQKPPQIENKEPVNNYEIQFEIDRNKNNQINSNNNHVSKPFFFSKHDLLYKHSLKEVNELIYKDYNQLEKFLYYNNYKNTNNESILICLKYIEYTNFFFNKDVLKKIKNILNNNINNNHNNYLKNKYIETYNKIIPFEEKYNYLKTFYDRNPEKNLYYLFKNELKENYFDKNYINILFEIFEIVKIRMDNRKEEIRILLNKLSGGRKYSYQLETTENEINKNDPNQFNNNTEFNKSSYSRGHYYYKNNYKVLNNNDKDYRNNRKNSFYTGELVEIDSTPIEKKDKESENKETISTIENENKTEEKIENNFVNNKDENNTLNKNENEENKEILNEEQINNVINNININENIDINKEIQKEEILNKQISENNNFDNNINNNIENHSENDEHQKILKQNLEKIIIQNNEENINENNDESDNQNNIQIFDNSKKFLSDEQFQQMQNTINNQNNYNNNYHNISTNNNTQINQTLNKNLTNPNQIMKTLILTQNNLFSNINQYILLCNQFILNNKSQLNNNNLNNNVYIPLYNYGLSYLFNNVKSNFYQKNLLFNKIEQLIENDYRKLKRKQQENPLIFEKNLNAFEENILLPIYNQINELKSNNETQILYTKTYNKYKNLIENILRKNNFDKITIQPYGSIINNFLVGDGDIDISIVVPENLKIQNFDNCLHEIMKEIENQKFASKINQIIFNQRYSLLSIIDNESKILLDITVHNLLPINNSKMIRLYSLYDQRFHILGIFLKNWVKINLIKGAHEKFLSSYALLILIIHFLQNIIEPKVLPVLQQIQNENVPYNYFYGDKNFCTNLYYEKNFEKIKEYMKIINGGEENCMSVTELLIKFFEFYAYEYNHYLISIKNSNKIEAKKNEEIAFPIEDPFESEHNPGHSMKINSIQYLQFNICMKKEINNILSGEYFKFHN